MIGFTLLALVIVVTLLLLFVADLAGRVGLLEAQRRQDEENVARRLRGQRPLVGRIERR